MIRILASLLLLMSAVGVSAQILTLGAGTAVKSGGGGGSLATFDPANKDANVILSNGNLTASVSTGSNSTDYCVKTTTSHSTGKYHIEWTVSSIDPNGQQFGIAPASSPNAMPGNFWGLSDAVAFSMGESHFYFYNNGANNTGNVADNWNVGDTLALEFDLGGLTFGFQNVTQGSGWFTASISAISGAGPWFAGYCVFHSPGGTGTATANFGQSSYMVTPTSGYGNW